MTQGIDLPPPADLLIVPIPIRPGLVVQVQYPTDITADEAEKVARVVIALGNIRSGGETGESK
jgi:hypothetical protein